MSIKNYSTWIVTCGWCQQNPDKLAAIITSEGVFEIKFKHTQKRDDTPFSSDNYDWINKHIVDQIVKDL